LSQSQFDRLCLRRGEAWQGDAPLADPDAHTLARARRLAAWRLRLAG
jgi:hypothetical protein